MRYSLPQDFYELLQIAYGDQKASKMAQIMLEKPRITVRANTIRTSQQDLFNRFEQLGFLVQKTRYSQHGIRFQEPPKGNFFQMQEFKSGHFEIQDEGSQLLAARVDAKPKELVLDYCAGSGGKTLAFAPFMYNKGCVYLHDIRKTAQI